MHDTTHPEIGATAGDREVVLSRDERALITDSLEYGAQSLRLQAACEGSGFSQSDRDDLARHETLLSRFRAIDGVTAP